MMWNHLDDHSRAFRLPRSVHNGYVNIVVAVLVGDICPAIDAFRAFLTGYLDETDQGDLIALAKFL